MYISQFIHYNVIGHLCYFLSKDMRLQLLGTFHCMSFGEHFYAFLSGMYLQVELLGKGNAFIHLPWKLPHYFPKVVVAIFTFINQYKNFTYPQSLPVLGGFCLSYFSHSHRFLIGCMYFLGLLLLLLMLFVLWC